MQYACRILRIIPPAVVFGLAGSTVPQGEDRVVFRRRI